MEPGWRMRRFPPSTELPKSMLQPPSQNVEVPSDIGLGPTRVQKAPRYATGRFPSGNALIRRNLLFCSIV